MRVRKADQKMLKKLVKTHELDTMKEVAKGIGVSTTILREIISGRYKPDIKETTRMKICDFFGVSENELFPFVGANKEKAS